MYILALNGSHNNDGNTAFSLNGILRHCAEKGAETEVLAVSVRPLWIQKHRFA